jgi:hypothetical protein
MSQLASAASKLAGGFPRDPREAERQTGERRVERSEDDAELLVECASGPGVGGTSVKSLLAPA